MSDYDNTEVESTDLQQRDVRALTEYMTVLPLGGDVYSVTTQSGSEYRVDAVEARCTCPDKQYNLEDSELCKHERRVRFATGRRAIPMWTDTDEIDDQLGEHIDGTPKVAVTDGGLSLEESSTDNCDDCRPDDCECGAWNDDAPLACWPCYREGFKTPNPDATEEDE